MIDENPIHGEKIYLLFLRIDQTLRLLKFI